MPEFTLRITGPTACGSRISGPPLRDLLGLVSEGSRRALWMRVEGRSIAMGIPPTWLDPGCERRSENVARGGDRRAVRKRSAHGFAHSLEVTMGDFFSHPGP